jgi:hypothetical protein
VHGDWQCTLTTNHNIEVVQMSTVYWESPEPGTSDTFNQLTGLCKSRQSFVLAAGHISWTGYVS